MPKREIEEFGKIIVQEVRDVAIQNCDMLTDKSGKSPVAQRWKNIEATVSAMRVLIPDIVDEVMFALLNAIDQGLLRMKYVDSNGVEIDLTEDGLGELGGWYSGSDAWRTMFSKERFVDDFKDLNE